MSNPRKNNGYARMKDAIDLIDAMGPMTIDELCDELGISKDLFKEMRYGLPGRLALEDAGVSMPRPVAAEGYKYKIAQTYHSGDTDSDGELNLQKAILDILTRQSTIYIDVEALLDQLTPGSKIRKMVKGLKEDMAYNLRHMGKLAEVVEIKPGARAKHVLDKVS